MIFVDAGDDVVALFEGPAGGGAGAHGQHILRLGHLVVEAHDVGHHLLGDRARDEHQIGLAGRGADDLHAEAAQVKAGGHHRHQLDGAAGQAERHRPHRAHPSPVIDVVDGGQEDVLLQFLGEVAFVDLHGHILVVRGA